MVLLADGLIDLRLGRWQDVLADVETCDSIVADPPYSARTHEGQRHGRKDSRYRDPNAHPLLSARGINYDPWDHDLARDFVEHWSPRSGWLAIFTSHDLASTIQEAARFDGRCDFAPLACVQHAMNVRLAGDGPSNWTTWLCVSRPARLHKWGSLPGAYVGASHDEGENSLDRSKRAVPGGKPMWLMQAIIRDYTRPGDLVVDPFCGGGTTALACAIEGRRCITSEMDPVTFEKARKRLERGFTPGLFQAPRVKMKQGGLL